MNGIREIQALNKRELENHVYVVRHSIPALQTKDSTH